VKQHYVKTTNHGRMLAGLAAVSAESSQRINLLTGAPGSGKSTCIDYWGSSVDAIYLEGVPGMTLPYLRDYLSDQTGVPQVGRFAQYKQMIDHFRRTGQAIILDEAQHGLDHRAAIIEYLRRIVDQSESTLVLVCHTSEKHRFSEDRLAHIATRVAAVTELQPASVEDVGLYLSELCEVSCDAGIAAQVHAQSGGRYRLMVNAAKSLEFIAGKLGKSGLVAADVKGVRLCEDAMRSLSKRQGSGQ
jgi:hypothetical protein